jgi:hypothetical protein
MAQERIWGKRARPDHSLQGTADESFSSHPPHFFVTPLLEKIFKKYVPNQPAPHETENKFKGKVYKNLEARPIAQKLKVNWCPPIPLDFDMGIGTNLFEINFILYHKKFIL